MEAIYRQKKERLATLGAPVVANSGSNIQAKEGTSSDSGGSRRGRKKRKKKKNRKRRRRTSSRKSNNPNLKGEEKQKQLSYIRYWKVPPSPIARRAFFNNKKRKRKRKAKASSVFSILEGPHVANSVPRLLQT